MSDRPVYILDAAAFTPAYCNSLIRAMQTIRSGSELLTSASIMDAPEPADRVPGRRYYFLRVTRPLRVRAKNGSLAERLARYLGFPEYVFDCCRLLLRCALNRPVLHVEWTPIVPVDTAFLHLARRAGARIVYTVHNPVPHDSSAARDRRAFGRLYRLADHLILHSDYQVKSFEDTFPEVTTPRTVIPIGLLLDEVAPVPREDARRRLGWQEDECVLLFLGLIKPYKGLDVLLEAVAAARCECPLRLVIAGSWRFVEDRTRYDSLIAAARAHHSIDVEDRIPERDETADLLCAADALAQPYRSASASAPGMIAMRFGTPIIASNTGSFPQMLAGDLSEWLVPPEDTTALTRAIERLSRLNAAERDSLRNAIRTRGESEFGWPNIAKKTSAVYAQFDA